MEEVLTAPSEGMDFEHEGDEESELLDEYNEFEESISEFDFQGERYGLEDELFGGEGFGVYGDEFKFGEGEYGEEERKQEIPIDDTTKQLHAERYAADEEITLSRLISGDFARITYPLKPLMMEIKEVEEDWVEEKRMFGRRSILSLTEISAKDVYELRNKLLDANYKLQQIRLVKRVRNTILQMAIANYYKKKKMDYCLREVGDTTIFQIKYFEKLDEYKYTVYVNEKERSKLEQQITNLQAVKDRKHKDLDVILNELYSYVAQIGQGLIFSKSGRTLSERFCTNFLGRIKNLGTSLANLRTIYINFQDRVAQRDSDLKGMDCIGESKYSLMYYEKLSTENRLRSDKVEEKEADLAKIRKVLQDNYQIVSHMKEKAIGLAYDITDLHLHNEDMREIIDVSRHWMNHIKCQRDNLRSMLVTMKMDSGFLVHPELLRDLQDSRIEHERLKKEYENLKSSCNTIIRQLRNARKFMEMLNENQAKRKMSRRYTKKNTIIDQKRHLSNVSKSTPNNLEDLTPTVKKLQVD